MPSKKPECYAAGTGGRCSSPTRSCRNCKIKYPADRLDIVACPKCGNTRPCKRAAGKANGRCFRHGGRAVSGPAHGNWRHGGRGKFLEGKGRQVFEEALNDPELIKVDSDLALVEVRLAELLEANPGIKAWREISGLLALRARLVQVHSDIVKKANLSLEIGQVMAIGAQVVQVINEAAADLLQMGLSQEQVTAFRIRVGTGIQKLLE